MVYASMHPVAGLGPDWRGGTDGNRSTSNLFMTSNRFIG